jgi:integrase/recombinase XerD
MACLLLLIGLRVSEVCGIDIADLDEERWHHTATIHGKGDKDATIPLAPRTRAAVEQAVDGRDDGPLLRNRWGNRMSRNNVAASVAGLACEAGAARRMTPHTLRDAAITAALNAGAHLRDVQDFARHADPKTTMRYDRNRHSLDRHATYAIAPYIAGSE